MTKAKALQDKINDRNYELGLVPDLNVAHVGTTSQLRKVIQKDNDLTEAETNAITFKPQVLVPGTTVPVAMELYGSVLFRGFRLVPIQVKIFQSAVQYVNNIKRAFDSSYRTGVNFILFRNSFRGQKASSPTVTAFLRQEIVSDTANTSYAITPEMAEFMHFANVTLRSGTNLVGITIGSASQTFGIILRPQVDFRVSL